MSNLRSSASIVLILSVLVFGACSDDPSEPEGPGTVVLQFDHVVDGQPLQMNSGTYTNAAGNEYRVTRLEYAVSDFSLTGSAGTYESAAPHYRDAGDSETRTLTFTDVPSGSYSTLQFVHGVPGSMNVAGAFPELDNVGMAWPEMMGGGYHYMRNEGNFTRSDGTNGAFTTHTGPTMGNDFSIPVSLSLPGSFEVEPGETVTIQLQMEVNNWYDGPTVYDFNDYGLIMGNMTVQGVLQSNGADVWMIGTTN